MSLNIARITSTTAGICVCHRFPIFVSGTIITNMIGNQMNVDGLPVATNFGIAIASCGHVGALITSSQKVFHSGIGITKLFDSGVGCYNFAVMSGSPYAYTPI